MRRRHFIFASLAIMAVVALAGTLAWKKWRHHRPLEIVPTNLNERAMRHLAKLGPGFLVWERNCDDGWQIWTKKLQGGKERQLVASEEGRNHFCPKISPEGRQMAYMSFLEGVTAYAGGRHKTGQLWVMDLQTRETKMLAAEARSYGEDRAVTWRSEELLCYINTEGETMERDLKTGDERMIIDSHEESFGHLPSRDLSHATNGNPNFVSLKKDGTMQPLQRFGGCQPYFTADSKWGYWTGGAGGPFNAIRLSNGEVRTILKRDDPRLDQRRNYIYFPMVSEGGSLLAFAASPDQHDHFNADYDLFVAHLNPRTMELIDLPVRYTRNPTCDRFPDVFRFELPLGTHYVEGETTVSFHAPPVEGGWSFDFGDEDTGTTGVEVTHVFRKPGDYKVVAAALTNPHHKVHGYVHVDPQAPPVILRVERPDEGRLLVFFDEEITVETAVLWLNSGEALPAPQLLEDKRTMQITLPATLSPGATVAIEGLRDRDQTPQEMPRTLVPVPLSDWPAATKDMTFVWRDGKGRNKLDNGTECVVEPHGVAFRNEHGAMKLRGGSFDSAESGKRICQAVARNDEFTIGAAITPQPLLEGDDLRPIMALGDGAKDLNFLIGQRGENLSVVYRTEDNREVEFIAPAKNVLAADKTHFLGAAYERGSLLIVVDGEMVVNGEIDVMKLSKWKTQDLRFGALEGLQTWRGLIERVVVYDRSMNLADMMQFLSAAENAVMKRGEAPVWKVTAQLVELTKPPTLSDIQPYKEALVRNLYHVKEQHGGSSLPADIVVTQWCWLGGQAMPVQRLKAGNQVELTLHRTADHSEIESLLVRDELSGGFDAESYFDVSDWDASR